MRGAAVLAAALALAACQPDLRDQPKDEAYEPSAFFADGTSARPLVAGTVAQGALGWAEAEATPPAPTAALLARGAERYGVFCVPCHGAGGRGNGVVVQRGFPAPPSYHDARLKAASARHLFDVVSEGWGVMYGYGDRVPPTDRWAIVLYLRAMQLAGEADAARTAAAGR